MRDQSQEEGKEAPITTRGQGGIGQKVRTRMGRSEREGTGPAYEGGGDEVDWA